MYLREPVKPVISNSSASFTSLQIPKSSSLTVPRTSKPILSGLRSLYMILNRQHMWVFALTRTGWRDDDLTYLLRWRYCKALEISFMTRRRFNSRSLPSRSVLLMLSVYFRLFDSLFHCSIVLSKVVTILSRTIEKSLWPGSPIVPRILIMLGWFRAARNLASLAKSRVAPNIHTWSARSVSDLTRFKANRGAPFRTQLAFM